MRHRQARYMLDQVRDFHGQFVDKTAARRVRMLLDCLAIHEQNPQKGKAAYEESASLHPGGHGCGQLSAALLLSGRRES